MKKDAIQTRNRKMSTKSKKGRKFSTDSDYSKAVMDMKYGSFSPQNMPPMNHLMSSNQHLGGYPSYPGSGFPSGFAPSHNMGYPSWNTGVSNPAGFGLSSSMVGAIA